MGSYSFPKSEKLKSRKSIDGLFEGGESRYVFPLRMMWKREVHPDNVPIKAGFSVPKKIFKLAVSRNLLKRRMREAYRINSGILKLNNPTSHFSLFFVYTSKEIIDYQHIEKAMKKCLEYLKNV